MEAWLQAVGARAQGLQSSLEEALREVGVASVERSEGLSTGRSGLLLFDDAGPDTVAALRDARLDGATWVLAVATHEGALTQGACWRLLRAGASDVFVWATAQTSGPQVAAKLSRWLAVEHLVASPEVRGRLVGQSKAWLAVLRQVVEVAAFTDASLLLLGESGTGKEEMARLFHALDTRRGKRELVTLDCTTVVPELSGSEFFGHEKGAFTGAMSARDGAFALADGGTLFLDELGELPLPLQAQLLRVVQERAYKRVGGNAWQHTEFRLVCATNRDLSVEVEKGGFRQDFFHRIAAFVCRLPPLRERPEDILPLARHFLSELRPDTPGLELDTPVREYLQARSYSGNTRELRQMVVRLCKRHVGVGPITVGDIPVNEVPEGEAQGEDWQDDSFVQAIRRALAQGVGLKDISRIASDMAIRLAITDEDGNLQRAAKRLGVTDRALQLRKAQWGG